MKIFGIVVVSNDMSIGRDVNDTPVNWASKEDQKFYLDKIVQEKPLGLMGRHTYAEVKNNLKKDSIYSQLPVIILDDTIDYSGKKFLIDKNNKHIFTKLRIDSCIKDLEYYSKYFNNNNVYILGGSLIYEMFLPFYDTFWLTVEKSVHFDNGIKLFSECNVIDSVVNLFDSQGLKLKLIKSLSDKTDVYEFSKN